MKSNVFSSKQIIHLIEPYFDDIEKEEILKTIESTWIAEGPLTRKFENTVADFLGVNYACAIPNGTLAITIACFAIGLKHEDEVLIPDFTMVGTANGVLLAGGKPVFVDVDVSNFNISPEKIEGRISKRTKAIIPVHFNGRAANMKEILRIAKKYNLFVIEDAAQAFGSKLGSKSLGAIGDIGCFSFSVPKIVTTGQGGMVVTNKKDIYDTITQLKDHGRRKKGVDIHDSIGFNFKFTDLQAAIGIAQMKKVSRAIKKKKKIYHKYKKLLTAVSEVKFPESDLTHFVPWFVDILVLQRDKLAKFLRNNNIETRIFYLPLHLQPAYKTIFNRKERFPNSTSISSQGIWLPSSVNLSRNQIKKVSDFIKRYYNARS